jgi:hypothetical protein
MSIVIDKTLTTSEAASKGDLESLKWIRANGGEWTYMAADNAARNGHLEVVKWIRESGLPVQQTVLRGTDTWKL